MTLKEEFPEMSRSSGPYLANDLIEYERAQDADYPDLSPKVDRTESGLGLTDAGKALPRG